MVGIMLRPNKPYCCAPSQSFESAMKMFQSLIQSYIQAWGPCPHVFDFMSRHIAFVPLYPKLSRIQKLSKYQHRLSLHNRPTDSTRTRMTVRENTKTTGEYA